jgi:hypothetical protein
MLRNKRTHKIACLASLLEKAYNKVVIRKKTATALAVLFLFFASATIALNLPMDHHGMMIQCPFMARMDILCPMTPLGHLSAWQEMFRAVSPHNGIILVLLAFLTPLFLLFWRQSERTGSLDPPQSTAFRNFHRDKNPEIQLKNFLLRMLVSGILHPKIYA